MTKNPERYFFDSLDFRNYLIPVSLRKKWEEWTDLCSEDGADENPDCWEPPEGVIEVENMSLWTFEVPVHSEN